MIRRAAIGMFSLALSLSGTPISVSSLLYGETATSQTASANTNWLQGRTDQLRQEFPGAVITSQQRTVERQAQLMLDRALGDPTDFVNTYGNALYAQRMVQWVENHPDATRQEAEAEFVRMINSARAQGSRISNHLNGPDADVQSTDIRTPSPEQAPEMERRIRELGGRIHREEDAVTGSHWHVDWSRNPSPTPTPTPSATPTLRLPAAPSTRPASSGGLTMDDSVPRQNSATSIRRNSAPPSAPSLLDRVVDFFIPSAYAGVSEESLAAQANAPSSDNAAPSSDNAPTAANPPQVAEPSGGETLITVDTPRTTGHIRPEDSIETTPRTVGDHTPGAAPDATVDATPRDGGSVGNSQNSGSNDSGSSSVSDNGQSAGGTVRGQQDFRDTMDRQARDFQQSQQQLRDPGSNAASSRPSYDENGNRVDSSRGRYDADGNYTQRPQGGYDENGNRADSTRARYDANGNYIQPSQPGSGGYGQSTRRPSSNDDFWNSTTSPQPQQSTRQNRVYNVYDNTSRPIGSGRSNAAQQFQNIQQQSAQRIRDIQSNRNTGGYISAPSVPFPSSMSSSSSSMIGAGNSYAPSTSSDSGSSGARLTFDDSVPRGNLYTVPEARGRSTQFGYDESPTRILGVTPREAGTRSQTAGIRLP